MRITKSYLRRAKSTLFKRVAEAFRGSDEKVKAMLKLTYPDAVPGTREDNLKVVIMAAIEECLPSYITD